jgi:hypothetical protein
METDSLTANVSVPENEKNSNDLRRQEKAIIQRRKQWLQLFAAVLRSGCENLVALAFQLFSLPLQLCKYLYPHIHHG